MKSFDRPRLTWIAPFALAALSFAACGDDETCSDDTCAGDGGGGTTSNAGGAGGAGGGGGAPPPPTVRVLDRDDVAGVGFDVVIHDGAGALVGHEKTNAAGEIAAPVPEGGSVSVLYVDDFIKDRLPRSRRVVLTVDFDGPALEPMIVRYEKMPTEIEASATTTLALSFPTLPAATKYTFTSSCKRDPMYLTTGSAVYADVPVCTADGTYDALVVAFDAENTVVDYAIATGQPFVGGGTSSPEMEWAGAQFSTATLGIANIPPGSTPASFSTSASLPGRPNQLVVGTSASVVDPGPDALVQLQHAADFGARHCQNVSVLYSSDPSGAFSSGQAARCGPTFEAEDFVWDASRLARFTLDPVDAMLPLHLGWQEETAGETGDLIRAEASWGEDDDRRTWLAYTGVDATEVAFPELPAELAAYAPQPGDTIEVSIIHRDYAALDGFADLLQDGEPASSDLEQQFSVGAVTDPVR